MSYKKTILIIIPLIVLTFSYGKWEYLSYKHGDEFIEPIQSSIDQGCFLENPTKIKVMEYYNNNAILFINTSAVLFAN